MEIQNNYDPHPLIRLEKSRFLTNLQDLLLQKVDSSSENPKFFPVISALLYFYFRLRSKTLLIGNTVCIDVSQPYGDGSQRLMRKDFKQSTVRVVYTISSSLVHNAANPTSEGSPYTKWQF